MGPLFALYTTSLSATISSLDINLHLHVDDIQIYMSLASKESLREVATLFIGCIGLDDWIQAGLNTGFSLGPYFSEKNP